MFCFFKQKTAYEMRISDWSSDVCSSDLHVGVDYANQPVQGRRDERRIRRPDGVPRDYGRRLDSLAGKAGRKHEGSALGSTPALCGKLAHLLSRSHRDPLDHPGRSEEHTSELQSLMRISYAVFCLKKKTLTNNHHEISTIQSQQ